MREPSPAALRRALWSAVAVLALGVAGFLVTGANRPPDPYLLAAGQLQPAPRYPGFDEVGFTVTSAGGIVDAGTDRAYCGVLAATTAQQNRGLMGRHRVGPYAGMVFSWPAPTTTYFYMKDTVLPLSIAWFSANGSFLAATNMAPCPPATRACPLYRPAAPYRYALEVPQGRLGALGVVAGSSLHLIGPCIP
jgi:uncharacterized membrane protein (UPF0127 family)